MADGGFSAQDLGVGNGFEDLEAGNRRQGKEQKNKMGFVEVSHLI